jgi:hypothetical protein
MAQWIARTEFIQELRLLPDFVITIIFNVHGYTMHCKKLNLNYRKLKAGYPEAAQAEALAEVTAVLGKMNDALSLHAQPAAV